MPSYLRPQSFGGESLKKQNLINRRLTDVSNALLFLAKRLFRSGLVAI